MIDVALHTGTEHPELVWLLAASVLSFVLGVGVGSYSTALRERLSALRNRATDR